MNISLSHNVIEKKKFLIKYLLNNAVNTKEKLPQTSNFDALEAAIAFFFETDNTILLYSLD
ncbi:MAG: hypothetical protein K0S01_67 [Herbinix sp.]|jgi:hypothetical protein|nr:hypothetical protein [Herbinix sp.]